MNAAVPLLRTVARATVGVNSQVPSGHVSAAIGLGTDRHGTGTFVSAEGHILTVHYLLLGAESVTVTLVNGERMPATIIAADYYTGLGLLKVDGAGYPHLKAVSSQGCNPGQEAFTIASLGGEKRCCDAGVVTYTGPFDAVWEFVLERCLCVTASSLNIGLSGGPICNARGEVIGVSYLNFADPARAIMGVPGECFLNACDELLKFGRRVSIAPKAWLGLLSYTTHEHVVIAGVMPGGPGDKAGLRQGDLVITVDDHDVSERRALYEALCQHRPGDSIALKVMRNNRVVKVTVPAVRVEDYFA